MLSVPPKVRCRQIGESDIAGLVDLLDRGFPERGRAYWRRGLDRLAAHAPPPGLPKFGYVLESRGRLEGVVLTIFSHRTSRGAVTIRCNLSSWYVSPSFRGYAALLNSNATRLKNAVYVNMSPAPHTRSVIEAAGFSLYSNGQFATVPAFAPALGDCDVRRIGERGTADAGVDPAEDDLLRSHARLGCISLWCATPQRAVPLVFLPRLVKGIMPCAQLIYCRDIDDFVRLARPVGRYLAARGRPIVIVDANGPIAGLKGKFFAGRTVRYFKGDTVPGLSDLAYTEAVMFGV